MKRILYPILLFLPALIMLYPGMSFPQQAKEKEKFTMCRIRRITESTSSQEQYSFSPIAREAVTHAVNISTVQVIRRSPYDDPTLRRFFGPDYDTQQPPEHTENSLGSGVFISEDGFVVTNNHVVENAGRIRVIGEGQREFDAEVVGTDPGTDLAVIRLKGGFQELTPVAFGNSDSVRIGDVVLAIGSPFSLNRSVSMGIVSGKSRANFGIVEYENFIQTDAAINPGNSGGALVNMRGELIGINSAILSSSGGSQGIGFSIPSNMVLEVVEQILRNGRVIRGDLGVAVQRIDQDITDAFNLTDEKGVIVTHVIKGSPAEKAGIKREDVILQVDGKQVELRNEFRNLIAFTPPGKQIRLQVLRKGKELTLNATLTELETQNGQKRPEGWKPRPGGLGVAELNPQSRRHFQVPDTVQGIVVVAQIESGSAAELAGFYPGDVIIEVNRTPVTSLSGFMDLYRNAKGNTIYLVQRKEGAFFRYMRSF
jgi:serine protease Do